jgi:copper chaperone CopZ
MMRAPHVLVLAVAALSLSGCALMGRTPTLAEQRAEASVGAADPADYLTFTLKVTGMTCPIRCVHEVHDQLRAVPGVLRVQVDYDERRAIVDVRPGTDPDSLSHGLKAPYAGRLL